jgi:hypothetical protein
MESSWRGYFAMCPDDWIRADHAIAEGDTMLIAGQAARTIDGQSWRMAAAWKMVGRDGRVAEWRVLRTTSLSTKSWAGAGVQSSPALAGYGAILQLIVVAV